MKPLAAIVVAVAIAFGVGTWFGTALVASRINNSAVSNCRSVNVLDEALIGILDRSFKALPQNSFYKKHPDELATALRQTAQAIDGLQAARCSIN